MTFGTFVERMLLTAGVIYFSGVSAAWWDWASTVKEPVALACASVFMCTGVILRAMDKKEPKS